MAKKPLQLVTQCLMHDLDMSEQEIKEAGIRLLEWALEKRKNGYKLLTAKGDDIREVDIEALPKY